jgi:hypothetical protein
MKIISKHKDYYDYFQGIYGVDKMKILDRRSENPYTKLEAVKGKVYHYTFSICNELYDIFYHNGNLYHTYKDFIKLSKETPNIRIYHNKKYYQYNENGKDSFFTFNLSKEVWDELQGRKTNLNSKMRKSILVQCSDITDNRYRCNITESRMNDNVILSEFKFIKKLDAQSIYSKLDMFIGWLNDNPEKKSNITNIEKIKSKGFDTKKSFRHRK